MRDLTEELAIWKSAFSQPPLASEAIYPLNSGFPNHHQGGRVMFVLLLNHCFEGGPGINVAIRLPREQVFFASKKLTHSEFITYMYI